MLKQKYQQLLLYAQFRGITTMEYTQTLWVMQKRATTNSAFGFCDTQANAEKPKELFFANAQKLKN